MSSRIEVDVDGQWKELTGALLHIGAFEFRAIITSDVEMLAARDLTGMQVRVGGRVAERVRWSVMPDRGYASCEMRLPMDQNPTGPE